MKPRNPTDFYLRSAELMELAMASKGLLDLWATRYAMIVDHSHRAEDCPYALQAARHHLSQTEELEALLTRIHDLSADLMTSAADTHLSAKEIVESYEVSHGL